MDRRIKRDREKEREIERRKEIDSGENGDRQIG